MADLHSVQRPISALKILAKIAIAGFPDWVGIGGSAVWISNRDRNNIARIDPTTNQLAATVHVGQAPCSGLGIGHGSVWVPICGDQTLARVDPATNNVVATIPCGVADSEGHVAVGEDAVWMPSDAAGTLARIDPGTNKVIAQISVPPPLFCRSRRRGGRLGDQHRA
jgi:virginiamycin B lyase